MIQGFQKTLWLLWGEVLWEQEARTASSGRWQSLWLWKLNRGRPVPTAVTRYDNLLGLFPSKDSTSTSSEREPGGDQDREAERPETAWPHGERAVRVGLDGAQRHVHSIIVQMAHLVVECLLSARAHAPPHLHTGPA